MNRFAFPTIVKDHIRRQILLLIITTAVAVLFGMACIVAQLIFC